MRSLMRRAYIHNGARAHNQDSDWEAAQAEAIDHWNGLQPNGSGLHHNSDGLQPIPGPSNY